MSGVKLYKPSVCVDLDGTLATYDRWRGLDHIGDPRPGAKEFLAALGQVARVVIFTVRCKCDLNDRPAGYTPEEAVRRVRAWLDRHGLWYDEVYTGQGKPIASAFIDDRAVSITPNPLPGDFDAALAGVRAALTL